MGNQVHMEIDMAMSAIMEKGYLMWRNFFFAQRGENSRDSFERIKERTKIWTTLFFS